MSNPSVDDAPELDLKQIFAQLMARKWLIAVVSVIGACVGVAFAVIPPNEYRASAVVQIERRNDGISLPAELIGELLTGAKGGSSNFGTEIHVIKSRLTLEPAAQELGLLTEVRPKTLPIWGDFFLRTDLDEQVGLLDRYVSPSYARGGSACQSVPSTSFHS